MADVLERIQGMRGLLYRKLAQKVEEDKKKKKKGKIKLPGFEINKIARTADFPKYENQSEVDVTYPLIEPFAYANIKWDDENKELVYNVIEPELTEKDKQLLEKLSDSLIELVDVELSAVKNEKKIIEYLEKQLTKIIKEYGIDISGERYTRLMYYIYRNFVGFNEIEPFLQDPNIEDISCDGVGAPMYVVHRKFGSLKTNIAFNDMEYLREFIVKMSERAGRYVSYAEPVLEGSLPDGSRISATLAGDVATRGPTFTIRKFSARPFSPIEQLKMGTVSIDVLAYFWYIVENGASMLIVGGVATGKTSFMNSICMFIPPEAKIVSIEDTRELKIPNEHWVPTLARVGFGIPMPSGEKYGGVSLFDLLKQSFRQNPDYVIVGETRGKEAYVMFQGMSSGHPSMSTFHAGSVDTVIKRLTTPPINLSPTLIESLNIITVMIHAREQGKSSRRIREVVEIRGVDAKTGEVDTNVVFRWDPAKDIWMKENESFIVEKFVEAKGGTMAEAAKTMEERKKVLTWMEKNEILDFNEVTKVINRYYKERSNLMKEVGDVKVAETIKGKIKSEVMKEAEKVSEEKEPEMKIEKVKVEQIEPELEIEPKATEEKEQPEPKEDIKEKVKKDMKEKIKRQEKKESMDIDKLRKVSVLDLFNYGIVKEGKKAS